jgi:hypothetical protein
MLLPLLTLFAVDRDLLLLAGGGAFCIAYWAALAWGIWSGIAAIVGALS